MEKKYYHIIKRNNETVFEGLTTGPEIKPYSTPEIGYFTQEMHDSCGARLSCVWEVPRSIINTEILPKDLAVGRIFMFHMEHDREDVDFTVLIFEVV